MLPHHRKRFNRDRTSFNPHPARKPDATSTSSTVTTAKPMFQSSPGPKAGCYGKLIGRQKEHIWFQSSPGPKAGCYHSGPGAPRSGKGFQSSPGPKAGCYNSVMRLSPFLVEVSILTRPESRMLRQEKSSNDRTRQVSILTRPESRMLRSRARWDRL